MTTKDQVNTVLAALNKWAGGAGGRAFVASDPLHVLEELRNKPGAPTVAVLWQSEEPLDGHGDSGQVRRQFKIVLSRGRGLSLVSGESLTKGAAGGAPMFDLVEQAREVVRGLRFTDEPDELAIPDYDGSGPWQVEGYLLDAFEVRFTLFASIPEQLPGATVSQ